MPKKNADDFEYLSNNPDYVPDPEIEEFMELEISRAPKDPDLLDTCAIRLPVGELAHVVVSDLLAVTVAQH